jgi:hypothetical protein
VIHPCQFTLALYNPISSYCTIKCLLVACWVWLCIVTGCVTSWTQWVSVVVMLKDTQFGSWPGYHLSWLRCFMVFLNVSKHMTGDYLDIVHDYILPKCLCTDRSWSSSFLILCCITSAIEVASLNKLVSDHVNTWQVKWFRERLADIFYLLLCKSGQRFWNFW